MITKTRDRVGPSVVAIPAMFGARFVVNFAAVVRILGALEKVIDEVDGIVEIVVVGLAHVDVKFAFEFRSQLFRVPPEDVTKVEMLPTVLGNGTINLSSHLVPDRFRVPIFSNR